MEFDKKILQELGVVFEDESDYKDFIDIVQEELEVRIGERISSGKTERELAEFDACHNPDEVSRWLEKNAPNYREIVKEEIKRIKKEITLMHDNIQGVIK